MILPFTLSLSLCFTPIPILVTAIFLCATPFARYGSRSAISSFATSSAALGSYAYPIRSHIVLTLTSSSPLSCLIALLFAIISRTFYPPLAY